MKSNLAFEFSVNDEENSIVIKRGFETDIPHLWDAWTKSELLDQWWAPQPYKVETKEMNFGKNGNWFYAMVSPEGEKHWCNFQYLNVSEGESFRAEEIFCDENGDENNNLPKTVWTVIFGEDDGNAAVYITLGFKTDEDLRTIIQMGFKEGFEMCLDNLDEVLENNFKTQN